MKVFLSLTLVVTNTFIAFESFAHNDWVQEVRCAVKRENVRTGATTNERLGLRELKVVPDSRNNGDTEKTASGIVEFSNSKLMPSYTFKVEIAEDGKGAVMLLTTLQSVRGKLTPKTSQSSELSAENSSGTVSNKLSSHNFDFNVTCTTKQKI